MYNNRSRSTMKKNKAGGWAEQGPGTAISADVVERTELTCYWRSEWTEEANYLKVSRKKALKAEEKATKALETRMTFVYSRIVSLR